MLLKMEGDCEACRSFGSAECGNGLTQFRGALLLRGALRLKFFPRVHAANDFQPFTIANNMCQNLRLAVGRRSIVGKCHPKGHASDVRHFREHQQTATGDIESFG